MPRRRAFISRAFTLVELLVVVGIISVLIAMLMPVLANVRRQARTAVCLSNLRQLGVMFQGHVAENRGRAPNAWAGPLWMFIPQNDTNTQPAVVFCPEATDFRRPRNLGQHDFYDGTARHAWGVWYARPPAVTVPWWGLRGSSYGSNGWTGRPHSRSPSDWASRFVSPAAKHADVIPLFADGVADTAGPYPYDTPPDNLIAPNYLENGRIGMRTFCIARHGRAINIVFLDGHAATTPLEELWKLKWQNNWVETDVVLPPGP